MAFGASSEIELVATCGLTHSGPLARPRWWKDVVVSLAGPAAGLALGGIVWIVARVMPPSTDTGDQIVAAALWVNVGWSLLNLLPVFPYDGGSALRAVLVAALPRRGEAAAHLVSTVAGAGACVLAIGKHMYWAAYLAGAASASSFQTLGHARFGQRTDGHH